MNKRELRKLAQLNVPAVIQSMDLEQLFGADLYMLGLDDGQEWVLDVLQDVKHKAVAKLTPKALRGSH